MRKDDRARYEYEACSVSGPTGRNEDYVLMDPLVGVCVGDGVGSAPMGDAVARLACHSSMEALRRGSSCSEALTDASAHVSGFLELVDSARSGASLMVARFSRDEVEIAWLGDVAFFAKIRDCGTCRTHSSHEVEGTTRTEPLGARTRDQPLNWACGTDVLEQLVICTDGVWRYLDRTTLAGLLFSHSPTREVAARLAMGPGGRDDATALVLRWQHGQADGLERVRGDELG